MTTARCPVHDVPVRDANLCPACTFDIEKDLGDVAALAAELDVTLSRQTAVGYREGGRNAEEPLPFNVQASTAAEELHATLLGWAKDLHDTYGDFLSAPDSISLSRWLLARIGTIRQHPTAQQLRDEISYAVEQARRAVDRPKNRSRVFVGACLEDDCDGELWARFPLAEYDQHDPATHAAITCTVCPVTYPADQWLRVGTRLLRERQAS